MRERAGSARNQRTTSGTESMFRSVTVQLCASSKGNPVRVRIFRARFVNASRTGCRSLSLVRRLIGKPCRPAWVISIWTATWRSPPSSTSASRNSGCSSKVCPCVMSMGTSPTATACLHDFDQFCLAPAAPIGVGDIAASDLQSAARPLQTAVRFDLLLHLLRATGWDLVRVLAADSNGCNGRSNSSRR